MNEFLVACVPAEHQLDRLGVTPAGYDQNPTLIGGPTSSANLSLLKTPSLGVELLWPRDRANGGTLFVYPGDDPGHWRVPATQNANALRNRSNSDLLLFLGDPPAARRLLVRHGDKTRKFERGQVERGWFPEPHGIWTRRCPLFTRVFASVGGDPGGAFEPVEIEVGDCAGDPIAVLNPIVLRIRLDGDELATPDPDGGVTFSSAMRDLLDTAAAVGGLLMVEPVIPAEDDFRVLGLDALARHGVPRAGRSVIEEVLVPAGGAAVPWLPFLCLDLLNGRFRLDHPRAAPGGVWKSWGFADPEAARGNAAWFAGHWTRRWGGRDAPPAADEPVVDIPEDQRNPELRASYTRTGLVVRRAEYDAEIYPSCQELLKRLPDAPPFLAWARDTLSAAGVGPQTWHQPYIRTEVRPGRGVEVTVRFDSLSHRLAEELLFPASPVRVQLPPAAEVPDAARRPGYERAIRGRLVDLRRTVRWFARDFANYSIRPEPARLPGQIPWRDGWWISWYKQLFVPGAGPDFRFLADDSGFVLNESRLGLDVLGAGAGRYEQSENIVI